MPNAVVQLAYEEARSALREQDATLGNIRNRATGLLAAAAVGTSFSTGVGLLNTDVSKGHVLPGWAGWTLLVLISLLGAGIMIVLWPTSSWSFGPAPDRILAGRDRDIDDIRRIATQAMIEALLSNGRHLNRRMAVYRVTVGVLLLELVVLLVALILERR